MNKAHSEESTWKIVGTGKLLAAATAKRAERKAAGLFVPDSHPVRLCKGTGVRDAEPINVSTTVGAVEGRLLGEPLRLMLPMAELATPEGKEAKKSLAYIIGGPSDGVQRKGNGWREAENFPERDFVTLDVDTATPQFVADLRAGTGALSDMRYGWHTTVSSTREKPKLRIFLWPERPLTAVDHRRCVDGLKRAIEAEHEGVWIDPTCGDAAHIMFRPAVCCDGDYDAGQNPGHFLDVAWFVSIAEAAGEEAKRQAEEQQADAQDQREQARTGGYKDDAPEIQSRWREVLTALGVLTERAWNPKAALASECPHCGPDLARVEWTAEGLWTCRVCGKGSGGNVISFVRALEGLDGNSAFTRCRELLGIPYRSRTGAGGAGFTLEGVPGAGRADEDDGGRRSQADVIAEFSKDMVLFVDASDKSAVYADVSVDGHRETMRVDSTQMREYLRAAFYAKFQKTVRGEALAQAIESLRAQARYGSGGLTHTVGLRSVQYSDGVVLDLANKDWQVVEVTAAGWRVVSTSSVRMRRAALGELPIPTAGSIEKLREFVNLKSNDDFVLLVSFMLAALRGSAPFPALVLLGEQGTGKSTLCRIIKRLCDPSEAPLRSLPSNVQDLLIAAQGQHVVVFDNVSHIQPWLSDGLCRLSDGAGIGQRTLYTNDEETVLAAARPVVLNGISDFVTRGDLADRSIAVTLETIPEAQREDATLFWQRFEDARPAILAALLDGVAHGLRVLPSVRTRDLPRMAGFARWGMACEGAFWGAGAFEAAYDRNRESASAASLEEDVFIEALRSWADADVLPWSGRPKDLLAAVTATVDTRPKDWPNRASAVVGIIRRSAPALRRTGLEVAITKRSGRTYVELGQRPKTPQVPVVPVVPVGASKILRNTGNQQSGSRQEVTCSDSAPLSANPEQERAHDRHDRLDGRLLAPSPRADEDGGAGADMGNYEGPLPRDVQAFIDEARRREDPMASFFEEERGHWNGTADKSMDEGGVL